MCDFSAVRNWLIGLGAVVTLGVSSAFFGLGWVNAGPLAYISTISFWAAAAWCALAMGLVQPTIDAVSAFCRCATNPACRLPCDGLPGVLRSGQVTLGFLMLACLAAALLPGAAGALLGLVGAALMLTFFSLTIISYVNLLGSCQPGSR